MRAQIRAHRVRIGAGLVLLVCFAAPIPGSRVVAGSTRAVAPSLGSINPERRSDPDVDFRSATLRIGTTSVDLSAADRYVGADGAVITTRRIQRFLEAQGAPLAPFARDIVSAGIKYGVDPRVVVAISGVESTFGLYQLGHNAWGWGRYTWPSWPSAIDSYTRMLGAAYRSLRTGRFMVASRTYCPPCGEGWGVHALEIFARI